MSALTKRLIDLVNTNLNGNPAAVVSVCSSHPMVIEAALERSLASDSLLLIESTSNQVDQFGGYSGMKPSGFKRYVEDMAAKKGFDCNNLMLGGDHLGPNRWKKQPAINAMNLAHEQILHYVQAGYKKIHLDASMPLADDMHNGIHDISEELVAERTASLCKTAEDAFAASGCRKDEAPLYVIGTEVPMPGGEAEVVDCKVAATSAEHVEQTMALTHKAFIDADLGNAWERVIALVVQPKIDFGNDWIIRPDLEPLGVLKSVLEVSGRSLCYEAHSTDYQDEQTLRRLVEHHFAFLKVGPALSFALRQTLYAMEHIERMLYRLSPSRRLSNLQGTIDEVMDADSRYWRCYCPESSLQYALKHFGLSDRTRYYLGHSRVVSSIETLFNNLKGTHVPSGLVRQYLPMQSGKLEEGIISFEDPQSIVHDAIGQELGVYYRAARQC